MCPNIHSESSLINLAMNVVSLHSIHFMVVDLMKRGERKGRDESVNVQGRAAQSRLVQAPEQRKKVKTKRLKKMQADAGRCGQTNRTICGTAMNV
jgi:hypothetical protein